MFRAETVSGALELPSLAEVPEERLREALKAPEAEQVWVLIESIVSSAVLAQIDDLDLKSFEAMVREWEAHSGVTTGDLLRIAHILTTHPDALAADLIDKGLRLRYFPSSEHNWHDLKVIVHHLKVDSNLRSAMFPDQADWTRQNLLLADVADSLHWLMWAQTKDGKKNRNRPAPIPRPGVTPPPREGAKPKPSPLSVIKERFANRRGPSVAPPPEDRAQKLNDLFAGRR